MELKLENLTKRFRETAAVDGVSCTMGHGVSVLCLLRAAARLCADAGKIWEGCSPWD